MHRSKKGIIITVFFSFFRLPTDSLFLCHIIFGSYVVAHKFKKVNPTVSYSVFRISFTLAFTFLASCFLSYIYVFVIIQKFVKTENRIKKAIIAAITPGITFPITAMGKYLNLLRKSSEIVSPDRAFVLCYLLRGGSIVLYRTMQ